MRDRVLVRELSMAGAWVAIAAFFALTTPAFLSARNVSMLTIELSVTATLAVGMLLVILPGQIDLAAGSGVGLFGGVAAVLVFQRGWPAPLAMLVAVGTAVGVWRVVGWLVVGQGIPAFIATLGGLLVFRGAHWLVIRDATVPVSRGGQSNAYSVLTTYYLGPRVSLVAVLAVCAVTAYGLHWARRRERALAMPTSDGELLFMKAFVGAQLVLLFVVELNRYRGIPLPALVLAVVAFAVWVTTQHTPFGRSLYAIGGNEEAAFLSGIPVRRVVIAAYSLLGLIVGLTGLLQTAYAGASTTTVGNLMELDAIAACVIGGTSLRGGRGSVPGVLLGSLVIATLQNGMTRMAVSPEFKLIARGLVLGLAVWVDVRFSSTRSGAR
jgi:D-xylose transport system permease protein